MKPRMLLPAAQLASQQQILHDEDVYENVAAKVIKNTPICLMEMAVC